MSRSIPPSSEDVSVELTRAVLPTYLHHVLDASETLAVRARASGGERDRAARARRADRRAEGDVRCARVDTQGGTGKAGRTVRAEGRGAFARRAAAKRAADNAKLADLERARRAAVAEAGEIEVRLRVAEDAAAALRGAPGELRAVTRLLGDVMADLEADAASDDDDDAARFPPRAPRSAGSAVFGPVRRVRGPREPGGHRDGGGHSADAERVDPSVPMVTGAGHGGGARRRRRRRRAPEPRAAVPRGGGPSCAGCWSAPGRLGA